ncbi:GntR family transcriptional regulator [Streptomyces hyaluromycini]|uniref:GntR family transcriptional regulator n=1 Tax=Streptomyces hyaluromycini TaxID=1377993 RepID=UPI001C3F6600|nr:GntR family transcriptional regulator [Streptomyces hyaluromycini]
MKSTRDTIYDELRHRLTAGRYPQDASLVPLALGEEFAVSRTPVREALALLERDGLLVSTRRGFAVRQRSDEEMLELFELRAALDALLASSAAARRSPVDLARLNALLEHAGTLDDPGQIRHSLNEWHYTVRAAAHNTTVSSLLHTVDAQAAHAGTPRTRPGHVHPAEGTPGHRRRAADGLTAGRDLPGPVAGCRTLSRLESALLS